MAEVSSVRNSMIVACAMIDLAYVLSRYTGHPFRAGRRRRAAHRWVRRQRLIDQWGGGNSQ